MTHEETSDARMKEIRGLREIIRMNPLPSDYITAAFYLLNNCPSDIVLQVWADDPHLKQHLNSKLIGYCRQEDCLNGNVIARFWAELDRKNKALFATWVANNFSKFTF